jgi:hypothetical protein
MKLIEQGIPAFQAGEAAESRWSVHGGYCSRLSWMGVVCLLPSTTSLLRILGSYLGCRLAGQAILELVSIPRLEDPQQCIAEVDCTFPRSSSCSASSHRLLYFCLTGHQHWHTSQPITVSCCWRPRRVHNDDKPSGRIPQRRQPNRSSWCRQHRQSCTQLARSLPRLVSSVHHLVLSPC